MFELKDVRKDFNVIGNTNTIYFDSAATSLKPNSVIKAVNDFYNFETSNPHSFDYPRSYNVFQKIEECRNKFKDFINAHSSKEIIFTSGGTAALNIFYYSYLFNVLEKDDVILTTELEHSSNILPLFNVAKLKNANVKYIKLNSDGTFNIDNFKQAFNDYKVKAVCMTYISNFLAYLNPIDEICNIAHSNNAVVCFDAIQAIAHFKIDVIKSQIDFLAISGHKMLSPSGVGVLYANQKHHCTMKPFFLGGGDNTSFEKNGDIYFKESPYCFEAGTINIEGILGLSKAIDYINEIGYNYIREYDLYLKNYFINSLKKLDNVEIINYKSDICLITFNVKGVFAQDVVSYFARKGFEIRSGNFCAKLMSHAICVSEACRVSLYIYNTIEEIDKFIDILKNCTIESCIGEIV